VFAALLVAVGIFGFMTFNTIKGNLKSSVVTVPDVRDMPYDEAVGILQGLGLYADISDKKFDSEIEKGNVISQVTESGTTVKEGYTVSLVVSNGPITAKVPNILQKELSDAKLIIENNKLVVGEIEYVENDLPRGYVLEQNPKPGINVSEGSSVNVKVSEGKKILTVIMPNVVGKTIDDAQSSLSQINIRIGNIDYNYSSDYSENQVISQGISKGAEINEGTYVDLVVSKGKDPENSEEPAETENGGEDQQVSDSTETTENTSEDEGLVEKKFLIPLSKFENSSGVLRVELIQDGVSKVVYEKEHQKSDDRVRVVIKAKGEATIKSYYDGVEGDTIKEVF
jgi:serine/threonine-protein kinase